MTLLYSQLFDLVRKERSHQELQELPATFYDDAKLFFDEQVALLKDDPLSGAAETARLQIINGKKLLRQLYEYREQKILQLAQARCRTGSALVDTTKLLEEERRLFERLVGVLIEARSRSHIEDNGHVAVAQKREQVVEQPTEAVVVEEMMSVRIVKNVPQFLGKNMEPYGPFEEDSVVELPSNVADVLIRRGSAKAE